MTTLPIESIRADVDVGDWEAPPGSEAWAQAVRLRMLSVVKTLDLYPDSMRQLVQLMTEHQGWRVLRRRDGEPFRTFDEFCAHDRPQGLGKPYGEIRPYLEAVVGRVEAIAHGTSPEAAPPPGGKRERAGRKLKSQEDGVKNQGAHTRSDSSHGNSSAALAARIARDAPGVHERMKRGEFKSVRAAAVAAGIVKPKPKDAVRAAAKAVGAVPFQRLAEFARALPVGTQRALSVCLRDSLRDLSE